MSTGHPSQSDIHQNSSLALIRFANKCSIETAVLHCISLHLRIISSQDLDKMLTEDLVELVLVDLWKSLCITAD